MWAHCLKEEAYNLELVFKINNIFCICALHQCFDIFTLLHIFTGNALSAYHHQYFLCETHEYLSLMLSNREENLFPLYFE